MKWSEMTPQQRNALVAEKIMGWTEQPCDLDSHPEMELTIYDSGDACCPRCGAYEHINSLEHGIIPPPRYSESMDAAWPVIRMVNIPVDGSYSRYAAFIEEVTRLVGSDMFFDLFYCDPQSDDQHLTPERLCMAALRACGVEIEV